MSGHLSKARWRLIITTVLVFICGCTTEYTEQNEIPLVALSSFLAKQTVTGKVLDLNDVPVADASVVFVYGEDPKQTFGDTTGEDGGYSIYIAISSPDSVKGALGTSDHFQLFQNFPNPFNPVTIIPYTLTEPGYVDLSIYTALGHRIITLVEEYQAEGEYSAMWDGRNEQGISVASGIYLYRLQLGDRKVVGKMILADSEVGFDPVVAGSKRVATTEMVRFPHHYSITIESEKTMKHRRDGVIIPSDGVLDFSVVRLDSTAIIDTTRASTINLLMRNLMWAIRDRDTARYASLLADDFWFIEWDCSDSVFFENRREAELLLIGGSPYSSYGGIFDAFGDIQAYYLQIFDHGFTRRQGRYDYQVPHVPPDGEQWLWVYARFKVNLLNHLTSDGNATFRNYYVDQLTRIYMREDEDGLWRIVRWLADPIQRDEDCVSVGKSMVETPMESDETEISWAEAKRYLIPKQRVQ